MKQLRRMGITEPLQLEASLQEYMNDLERNYALKIEDREKIIRTHGYSIKIGPFGGSK